MKSRISNPLLIVPGAFEAIRNVGLVAMEGGSIPRRTLELMFLRASQINGCAVCVQFHVHELRDAGESDERIVAVAAWRETPFFSEPERAALALTEAATRLSDRSEAVPDEIWDEAARHYDELTLARLVLSIAMINAWNRINVTTRQIAGSWTDEHSTSVAAA
jgi:AhpD family alkylhydroperoxidase